MTRPERRLRITGSTARVTVIGPKRLVSICERTCSVVSSSKKPATKLPALLSSTSMRANRSIAAAAASSALWGSVTSRAVTSRFSCSPSAERTVSGSRPVATTLWPAARIARANSTPMPRPAPVMSQVFVMAFTLGPLWRGRGCCEPPSARLSNYAPEVDRRGEIREFLMSRRARVTPEQAGLYVLEGDVRRVPGLRREEVANLAGVSADYYTQLERGDVDGASDSVLNAVARALRLDDAERLHLFDLARPEAATRLAPSRGPIRPSVRRTLDAFTGGLALVRNRRWDYLAANALGRAVYAEIFDGRTGPPNHARYVFLDERARRFFDDWPTVAHDTARILRSEAGRDAHDPGPAELIDELSQTSDEFRNIWSQHDVRLPAAGLHRFHHPLVGELDLVFEAAELRADPGLTLLLATADQPSSTHTALRRLAALTARAE